MNSATARALRSPKRSPLSAAPATVVSWNDAHKQVLLFGLSDDLPKRWERIVQGGHA